MGDLEYKVHWKGWPREEASWEPAANIYAPAKLRLYRLKRQSEAVVTERNQDIAEDVAFRKEVEDQEWKRLADESAHYHRGMEDAIKHIEKTRDLTPRERKVVPRVRPAIREATRRRQQILEAVSKQEPHESVKRKQERDERAARRRTEQTLTHRGSQIDPLPRNNDGPVNVPLIAVNNTTPVSQPYLANSLTFAQFCALFEHRQQK